MKYVLLFLLALSLLPAAHAQMGLNSPAGVNPRQDMEIYTRNGLLVQQKYTFTTADPNASINTLSCATSPPSLTAQAGVLKDPGNDGNYPASQTCTQTVSSVGSESGYEVVFEDLDTELSNDRVIITDGQSVSLVFSGSVLPAPFFVTGNSFRVRFESNSNGTVGRGFRLRWRAVFYDTSSPTTPSTALGFALQFDASKGALLGGFLNTGAVSAAGFYSTALGLRNTASGQASTALGFENTASGFASTALGYLNTASGTYSTALGGGISTGGFFGAMALSDLTFNETVIAATGNTAANQLLARFRGGFRFISNYNNNTGAVISGAVLSTGSNSWEAISDSTKKERFQALNHADVLGKLGSLKLGSWNYKGQPEQRHYGPMAQDFFARFGHDGIGVIGCDTLLAGHDFTAVTLAGVQALIKENEQLKAKLAQTEAQTNARFEQSQTELLMMTKRLNALESVLLNRRDRVALRKRP